MTQNLPKPCVFAWKKKISPWISATMEKKGFIAADVEKKPMTLLPALFAGAFLAHHRFVKRDVIDNIYARLSHKD